MKKTIITIISVLMAAVIAIGLVICFLMKPNSEKVINNSNNNSEIEETTHKATEQKETIENMVINEAEGTLENTITKEMAYEGVNNYCHNEYDWSIAENTPEMMYVRMEDETETEYKVTFRSYTGSFVYFYVNKVTGNTRMIESVPTLNIENEIGTINLKDYLRNDL